MISAIGAGLRGIERSVAAFDKAATAIADPEGGGDPSIVEDVVAMDGARAQLEMSVAVLRTANQMTGTLLDIIA